MSVIKREREKSTGLRKSLIASFVSCLIVTVVTFAENSDGTDKGLKRTTAQEISFSERYAQRLQFHQMASSALDQAQARLEREGYEDIASRRRLGYSSRPMNLQDILPFRLTEAETTLPLAIFRADLHASQGISRENLLTLMESFNIQLHGDIGNTEWPDMVTLGFSVQRHDGSERGVVSAPMRFDAARSSYYFESPFDTYQTLMKTVMELTTNDENRGGRIFKPTLELLGLSGFKSLAAELEPVHFPRGVSVTHSVRLGEVRLATDYSWLGRPKELLALSSPQFLR